MPGTSDDEYVPESPDSISTEEHPKKTTSTGEARLPQPSMSNSETVTASAPETPAVELQVSAPRARALTTPAFPSAWSSAAPEQPAQELPTSGPSGTVPPFLTSVADLHRADKPVSSLTGKATHDSWYWIATPTSKCDVCKRNKRTMLYQCQICTHQVCKECSDAGNLGIKQGTIHVLNPAKVIPKPPEDKPKRTPSKRTPKKQATQAGRVPKTPEKTTKTGRITKTPEGVWRPPNPAAMLADIPDQGLVDAFHRAHDGQIIDEEDVIDLWYNHGSHRYGAPNQGSASAFPTTYAAANDQLAAAALTELGSGSSTEVGTGLGRQQISQMRSTLEPNDLTGMHPERSRGNPVRYGPYAARPQRRKVDDDPRREDPFVTRPRSLTDAARLPKNPWPTVQTSGQKGMGYAENVSPARLDRETSVSPESVISATKSQDAGAATGVEVPSQPRASSIRDITIDNTLRPLSVEAANGMPTVNRDASLPCARDFFLNIPPPEAYPAYRSRIEPWGTQYRHPGYGINQGNDSSHKLCPAENRDQGQSQEGRNDGHSQTLNQGNNPQRPATLAFVENFHPNVATVAGPEKSPLTGKAFPPARTNGEAYGMWQVYHVHDAWRHRRSISTDECLQKYTASLWEHLWAATQKMPVEEKFLQLRHATRYAIQELGGIDVANSRTVELLLLVESRVLAMGYDIDRSWLDEYRH